MKMTSSIKAVLRVDKIKLDGSIPVYYALRVGPSATRIPSGQTVQKADWNFKTNSPNKSTPYGQQLNTFLNKQISGFEVFWLTEQNMGRPATMIVAMNYFNQNSKVTLFSFYQEQIELWRGVKKWNTIRVYETGLKVLKDYNPKLNFGDLTLDLVERFDKYLREIRKNTVNGAFGKHKALKSIVNQAVMKGYMDSTPYRYFKIRSTPGTRMWLTIEEVRNVIQLEIPENKSFLENVRNMFVLGCLTGLRYSDVVNLKWGHIKEHPCRIEMKITKTEKALTIPLGALAKSIIDNYSKMCIKTPETFVMPQIANPVVNRDIKVIMKMAGINKDISFHCSRHTFASTHIQAKTNIVNLRDLLGHQKLDQTQIYAKSLTSDLFESMTKLEDMYSHAI
jgi:integrase/recombinase XerD